MAAIVGNHIDVDGEPSRDQLGVVAQGGLFVTDELEVFAQYLWGEADGEAEELSVAAIGVNYYWHEHNLSGPATSPMGSMRWAISGPPMVLGGGRIGKAKRARSCSGYSSSCFSSGH